MITVMPLSSRLLSICTAGFLLMPLAASAQQPSKPFADVDQFNLFYDAIVYVKAQGIVSGYTDGTYRPDEPINRAEFTKIIVGSKNDAASIVNCRLAAGSFSDVSPQDWYAPDVCLAVRTQLLAGYPDGSFRGAANINFAEAAKILSNAFNLTAVQKNTWYEGYVRALASQNAIPQSIGMFDQPLTRGEMAEMIYRLRTGNRDKSSATYEDLQGNVLTPYNGGSFSLSYPQSWSIEAYSAPYDYYLSGTGTLFEAGDKRASVWVGMTDNCSSTMGGDLPSVTINGVIFHHLSDVEGGMMSEEDFQYYSHVFDAHHCTILRTEGDYANLAGTDPEQVPAEMARTARTDVLLKAITQTFVAHAPAVFETTYDDSSGIYSITYPGSWNESMDGDAVRISVPRPQNAYVNDAFLEISTPSSCPAADQHGTIGTEQTVMLGGHSFKAVEQSDAGGGTSYDTILFTSQVGAHCIDIQKTIGTRNADPNNDGDYTPADAAARDKEVSAMQDTLKDAIKTIVIH